MGGSQQLTINSWSSQLLNSNGFKQQSAVGDDMEEKLENLNHQEEIEKFKNQIQELNKKVTELEEKLDDKEHTLKKTNIYKVAEAKNPESFRGTAALR